jgi:2-polyprenyl-3-methyl-5-hydroxy-6-metoxy-1,4-benzoquinol methylase
MTGRSCQVCAQSALEFIPEYAKLPRATSDSRPWPAGGKLAVCVHCGAIQKIPDAKWIDEIDRIYTGYDIYHQSAGSEQLIFSGGHAEPRSKRLIDYILREVGLPAAGRLLDIGCGNGAALRNFSEVLPSWSLHGAELNDSTIEALRAIPGFVNLHTGSLANIDERFSLITLIHTLEHVLSPVERLGEAARLLEPNGTLFVEVPNAETSPFDLLVADHLLHFTSATLGLVAGAAGLRPVQLGNHLIAKELTLLASAGRADAGELRPEHGIALAKKTVAWLGEICASVQSAAADGPLAIFGTAIAGMALYGAFRDSVEFFVDEDPHRIGRHYDGKPVLAPAAAPRDVPILLAFPPPSAQFVAQKCGALGLRCILPPPAITLS